MLSGVRNVHTLAELFEFAPSFALEREMSSSAEYHKVVCPLRW